MGVALPLLARMARCSCLCSTRDRDPLASRGLSPPLAVEEPQATARTPADRAKNLGGHCDDARGESDVGSTSDPRELLKVGFTVAQSTVSKYLPRHRRPPSQGWRTLLRNHLRETIAIDFAVVPTVTFGLLYRRGGCLSGGRRTPPSRQASRRLKTKDEVFGRDSHEFLRTTGPESRDCQVRTRGVSCTDGGEDPHPNGEQPGSGSRQAPLGGRGYRRRYQARDLDGWRRHRDLAGPVPEEDGAASTNPGRSRSRARGGLCATREVAKPPDGEGPGLSYLRRGSGDTRAPGSTVRWIWGFARRRLARVRARDAASNLRRGGATRNRHRTGGGLSLSPHEEPPIRRWEQAYGTGLLPAVPTTQREASPCD